ncbi:MAG: response regulator [Bdellovibrionales bacterium]|nr:response regulator [Bdellovibrionales bacterium]
MFPKQTHILVVDDSLNIRRLIVESLQTLGFVKISTAEDVTEAHQRLKLFKDTPTPVELILSDLNMPGRSGLDFLREVRAAEEYKALPFILITTESEKGAVIEAAVSGVSAYVVKPFNLEALTKRLKEAYKKHFPDK